MAMLLCAFAEMTGSPYLLCSHLEHRASQPNLSYVLKVASKASRLREIDIPYDAELEQQIEQATRHDLGAWSTSELADFHYSLVIQLADHRWLLVDPYQTTVAALPEAYGVDQAKATLERYADLYPGLTILADDGGLMAEAVAQMEALATEAFKRTKGIMGPLHETPFSPGMMTRLLDSKEAEGDQEATVYWEPDYTSYLQQLYTTDDALWFEVELRKHVDWIDVPLDMSALHAITQRLFSRLGAASKAMGEELFSKKSDEYMDDLMMSNIEEWETEGHTAATQRVFDVLENMVTDQVKKLHDDLWSGLAYAHPVIELMNPRFGLALALLNQLRCWTDNNLDGSVLLDYGSSQQFWHEAVDLVTDPYPSVKLERIETLVRQLPHHYPVVGNKLAFTPQGRNLSHGTRQQGDGHQRRREGHRSVA